MSDGAISQDEIDALLSGVSIDGLASAPKAAPSAPATQMDTSVLQKFADELKASLADNLGKMTSANFSAGDASVEIIDRDVLLSKVPEMVVNIMAHFSTALTGEHIYILAPEFAQKLVSLINKEENADIDDMALSVISEAVSTHTNDEIQALEKTGKLSGIACNPPVAKYDPKAMIHAPQGEFVLFSYPLLLDGVSYTLWEAVSMDVAKQMNRALGGSAASASASPLDMGGGVLSAADMAQVSGMASMNAGVGSMMGPSVPNVHSLQYPTLQGSVPSNEQGNIGLIMDVFMEMTVELGRTKKQIKDILGMGEGTIIELDKLAGEPVDILVNHKPIAKGEVVVIDENFGVRVTEILSSLERVTELH